MSSGRPVGTGCGAPCGSGAEVIRAVPGAGLGRAVSRRSSTGSSGSMVPRALAMMHVAHFCHLGVCDIAFAENLLDALLNLAARQQLAPAAPFALQSYISAEAYNPPIGAAAGMRLAQPHAVIQSEVRVSHAQPPSWSTAGPTCGYNACVSM